MAGDATSCPIGTIVPVGRRWINTFIRRSILGTPVVTATATARRTVVHQHMTTFLQRSTDQPAPTPPAFVTVQHFQSQTINRRIEELILHLDGSSEEMMILIPVV
jgi:hypothetical protein